MSHHTSAPSADGSDRIGLDAQIVQKLADIIHGPQRHADGTSPAVAFCDDLVARRRDAIAASVPARNAFLRESCGIPTKAPCTWRSEMSAMCA